MRRLTTLVTATVVALAGLTLTTTPAEAAETTINSTPAAGGWGVNGRVYASVVVGNLLVVGGTFTQAVGPGSAVAPRTNLAAFDLETGQLAPAFSLAADGQVRALASDGATVWVGGAFTRLGGATRLRLAALDATTGALRTDFKPLPNGRVLGLDVKDGTLYVGGDFTAFGSAVRNRAAAVDATSGALSSSFVPSADNRVNAVRADAAGTKVYLAGSFLSVNGIARTGLTAVESATGATTGPVFPQSFAPTFALDLNPTGTTVFTGQAGSSNSAAAYRTSTGTRMWSRRTDGDVQAVRYGHGNLFFGFHDGYQGVTTTKVLAADAVTGVVDPEFRPVVNQFWGGWSLAVTDRFLVLGGEFTTASKVSAPNLARFPLTPRANAAPTAVFTASASAAGKLSVDASGSSDRDGTVVAYGWDFGDGQPDATATGVTATHQYLTTGDYPVTLVVTDNLGGRTVTTQTVHVEVPTGPVPVESVVVARSQPWSYWYADTAPASGWNSNGFDPAGWKSGTGALGFGTAGLGTVIDTGFATAAERPLAAYFTKGFQVADAARVTQLTLETAADDGVVVYVNGTEVGRANMPAGTPTLKTYAAKAVRTSASVPLVVDVPTSLLVSGTNTVSAETHLNYHATPDLSYDLKATLTTVG